MNKEKDFLKTCFNIVAGLEVTNEDQAIAKEVVLSEVENLQQENKKLKDNWNKLKKDIGYELLKLRELKGQQKEFIKWLEDGIQKVKNTEFLDERIQRAGLVAYNRVLSKYKGIIGDDK